MTKEYVMDAIKQLANEIDEISKKKYDGDGKLRLIGSKDSIFLRSVAKKAALIGAEVEYCDSYDGTFAGSPKRSKHYCNGVIVDTETADKNVRLPKWTDIDFSYHDGMPAVSQAVFLLLKKLNMISGKNIAIVGRGHAVSGLAKELLDGDATVTIAHSKTRSLHDATAEKNVIVCATPKITQDIAHDTHDVVIDLGNSFPHPEELKCPYINRIGNLTTSILLYRFVTNKF